MAPARRAVAQGLRQFVRNVVEEAAHVGSGPSTSYNSQLVAHGMRYARELRGCTGITATLIGRRAYSSRALRRETESFMRQWRGFKTVAIGTGVGTVQSSQSLLTALLPPALLWLLCVLPSSYRSFLLRLWGYDPACKAGGFGGTASADSASPSSVTSPIAAALTWLIAQLHLTGLVSALADELALAARALYLCMLFLPALVTAPLASLGGAAARERWLRLVQWTLENAGPAFIKWGQWASTRPDLFPEDLCLHLEQLQTSAPAHSAAHSIATVQAAFDSPLGELFEVFSEQPLASGSIAQIHVATLSEKGAALVGGGATAGATVAVKVRHPGVTGIMHRDFILMQRAAALCSRLPGLAELRLEESIRQFGGPLKEQLDLSVEASHLSRFNANFRAWSHVRFPVPLYPLVSTDVLVESFEEGDLITRYVRSPHRHNAMLAQTGVDVFLTMMLKDNFIHADLHPGNLLVRPADPPSAAAVALASWLPASWARARSWLVDRSPAIVLLDTGMIVELSNQDQKSLMGFFKALTHMDGRRLAREILAMSVDGNCKDPVLFAAELEAMFGAMDREYLRRESQAVIRDIIEHMRLHQVTLRSSVSTVVVTSLVLEGWSSKLDPDVRILDTMRDMLGTDNWAERLGGVVDRVVGSGQLGDV
ncbi:hypothetical protein CHLRE_10g430800v5 [Chlamydomonas reinhardtii]|uniref:ABC1 atypical kinase-like domain-containing protein n=1 Tax=Chlamydomonas reinhardtii TaxID=3055 RepID=A0A2K3D9V4_CHLRE|nr:uncharacterized protein CHLRE_10g430800v5 [Chlamydomonas reinhardtii]PNW77308.1 hypothetical protein CHLRE_10g430800v5 [Chlamydomonas reinhardtii]